MRSRILVRAEPFDMGWIAAAYGGRERVIATCQARSEDDLVADLRATLDHYLATRGQNYLREMSYAGDWKIPNCPESFIRRPVDLWYCKIKQQACPIQAQVFVAEPSMFLSGCLLDRPKKMAILNTVLKGDYRGFHHVRGRYLCARCEEVRGNESGYSYHYPWELASPDDFAEFDAERDMKDILPKIHRAKIRRASVTNALCAQHCIDVANLLWPEVARSLRILEFELMRPGT